MENGVRDEPPKNFQKIIPFARELPASSARRNLLDFPRMGRPPLTVDDYQSRLDKKWPERFQVLDYHGYMVLGLVMCRGCKEEFEQTPSTLVARGNCPSCGRRNGQHHTEKAIVRAEAAAEASGNTLSHHTREGRRHSFFFSCPKHGLFAIKKLGKVTTCPKCKTKPWFAPTHPDSIPRKLRSKACVLYLIKIRDCAGIWTKVGISTNWESRQRHMKRDGVEILSEIRMHRTTLYEANTIEWALKQTMRRVLGRRACPRKKWSGWSESFKDPFDKFPKEFDRLVRNSR